MNKKNLVITQKMMMKISINKILRIKMMMFNIKGNPVRIVKIILTQIHYLIGKEEENWVKRKLNKLKNPQMDIPAES